MVGKVAKSHKKCKYLFYKKNASNHVMGYAIISRRNYTHKDSEFIISLSFAVSMVCDVVVFGHTRL